MDGKEHHLIREEGGSPPCYVLSSLFRVVDEPDHEVRGDVADTGILVVTVLGLVLAQRLIQVAAWTTS